MSDIKNVFISHIHEDDQLVADMKSLLAERGSTLRNASITKDRPNHARDEDYIKSSILAPGIEWAGTLVVIISPQTRDHWWVDWEIEYAKRLGRRIVGVWAHGDAECDVPDALKRYGDAVVGWQADRIHDAICGRINDWETSSGERVPAREIAHHNCS
jgi:MTH538 TIR-like domain (DUF1863)